MKYVITVQKEADALWSTVDYCRNKKELAEYFERLESQGLDWRVGYLLRLRDGRTFQAVVSQTNLPVKF